MKRRFFNRRTLLTLLLLLVVGAIVNVAVASAARTVVPDSWYRRSEGDANAILKLYDQHAPASFPRFTADDGAYDSPWRPVHCTQRTAMCLKSLAMQHSLGGKESVRYVHRTAGWPLHAFQAAFWEHVSAPGSAERSETGMWPKGDVARFDVFYWPIWPGFAINTLFYAAILWALFAAPFALRRHRRIKRGLCPACGYQVGGSPVCTECGKLLPSPSR